MLSRAKRNYRLPLKAAVVVAVVVAAAVIIAAVAVIVPVIGVEVAVVA